MGYSPWGPKESDTTEWLKGFLDWCLSVVLICTSLEISVLSLFLCAASKYSVREIDPSKLAFWGRLRLDDSTSCLIIPPGIPWGSPCHYLQPCGHWDWECLRPCVGCCCPRWQDFNSCSCVENESGSWWNEHPKPYALFFSNVIFIFYWNKVFLNNLKFFYLIFKMISDQW